MGGCTSLNWEKYHRSTRGASGYSIRPKHIPHIQWTSPKQLAIIDELLAKLEDKGVDVQMVKDDYSSTRRNYKRDAATAVSMIRCLTDIGLRNGISIGFEMFYLNLCKEKKTGKKIKYKTSKRYTAPTGYEFIGELQKIKRYSDGREEAC